VASQGVATGLTITFLALFEILAFYIGSIASQGARKSAHSAFLSLLMASASLWALLGIVEFALTGPRAGIALGAARYAAASAIAPLWFGFALTSGSDGSGRRPPAAYWLAWIVPLAASAIALAGPILGLPASPAGPGLLAYANSAYSCALAIAGAAIVLMRLSEAARGRIRVSILIAAAVALPVSANAMTLLGLIPPSFPRIEPPAALVSLVLALAALGAGMVPAEAARAGEAGRLREEKADLERKIEVNEKALAESEVRASLELEGRVRTERQLYHDALHDPLTGLANRSLFLSRLEFAISKARQGAADPFGLLYVNIDGFPGDQGEFGHEVEDAFLREAATRMAQCVRETDTVARIRGGDFALLLDGDACLAYAESVAERVSDELSVPFGFGAGSVVPSASIGVLAGGPDRDAAQDALRDADIAMHFAKASGRNKRATFTEEMRRSAFERNRLMVDLRSAIVSGGIQLAYQPIVRMDGSRAGLECLARWTNGDMGPVGPDRFIPLAEESGVISPLGTYVLIEALKTARAMIDAGLADGDRTPFFAINVSAHQLRQADFPDLVLSALERLKVPAGMIHLELTESALIEDRDAVIGVLGRLSAAGIHLKLDDFGTGYSSLNTLHSIPIDSVKIDKSFVNRLKPPPEDDASAAGIIRGIIAISHDLGKTVVAEGVESERQAEALREYGCDFAQGYYFGKAMDAESLRRYLGGVPAGA
jgi:diguanylate cyclase (GGDEF)-like protein